MAGEQNPWAQKGFLPNQVIEIEEGVKAGLDVSIYAKKEFYSMQMRQIRLGMLDALPVKLYATPEYDWFQMEEIRKGLCDRLDIEKYADPKLSYDRMRQIRKGLKSGIDLSPYKALDAGILREFRKATVARVNIVKYIKEGYEAEQLRQIRHALKKGLNIAPYITKEYRGAAIAEIMAGLERGIHVDIYAKIEYGWRQMREIRLGLEKRQDASLYANPYYDWSQMREIRLGLESGVDVERYRSLMYTPNEMKRIRLELEADLADREQNAEEKTLEEMIAELKTVGTEREEFSDFVITISDNEMEAYFITEKKKKITTAQIKKALEKKGITYGIIDEGISKIVGGSDKPVLIAKGTEAVAGRDGWYEYFFRTEEKWMPALLPDGSVDYMNSQWFQTVKEGETIAIYHDAEEGTPGRSVTGVEIAAKKGKEMSMIRGKGFTILPDGKTYVAALEGRIEMRGGKINISRMLVLEELTISTGKVDFNGAVYVKGNVGSGTIIKAEEDIVLEGFVEAADIECGGSVILKQGMNGSGTGVIRAKKDVKGGFFESVTIHAGGNVQGNYCLNSIVYANGRMDINGSKDLNGVLVGGQVFAVDGLSAYQLGNRSGTLTTLKIGFHEMMVQQQRELEGKMKESETELNVFRNAHAEFCKKYPVEVRNSMDMFLKIENAIYTKEKEIESLEKKRDEIEEVRERTRNAKVGVEGNLYEGCVVEINGIRWMSKDLCKVILKQVENHVGVFGNA